jgi:polygalacturonase
VNKPISQLSRRTFLASGSTALAYASAAGLAGCVLSEQDKQLREITLKSHKAWEQAQKIVRKTKVPRFPKRDFLVTDFGAKTDASNNSQAFANAITACHQSGGGRVVVPKGEFITGPIHLLSNVNLHLDEGCTLLFSTNPKDYLPAVFTRWEGMELMGYSPLVYAYQQENIALTGKGTLNGQANENTWWPWKGGKSARKDGGPNQDAARKQLEQDTQTNRPVSERIYADGAQLRPPFVQFYSCNTCLIEDVTITHAPFWLIHPVLSQNVTVRGVTCASLGPNSDGCDPESCKNVVIENCSFDTGDDCIAIKSGRNADGRRINVPSENIVIRNCKMRNGHGGVVIGSEISGGARNIFAENCEMSSPDLERGLRFKTNSVRGGTIENVYFRNIDIGDVQTAIVIDFDYEEGDAGAFTPHVKNIEVRNLRCKNAKQIFNVKGYQRSPIENLHLFDVQFDQAADVGKLEFMDGFLAKNVSISGKPFSI